MSKLITSKKIKGINTELLLLDTGSIKLVCNGEAIHEFGGNAWNNIKDNKHIIDATLRLAVESYTEKHSETSEIFKRMCEEMDKQFNGE